jgi:hypothetical protein
MCRGSEYSAGVLTPTVNLYSGGQYSAGVLTVTVVLYSGSI